MYFWERRNEIRDRGEKSAGCGILVKKKRECGIRTPPPPLPDPVQKVYGQHSRQLVTKHRPQKSRIFALNARSSSERSGASVKLTSETGERGSCALHASRVSAFLHWRTSLERLKRTDDCTPVCLNNVVLFSLVRALRPHRAVNFVRYTK